MNDEDMAQRVYQQAMETWINPEIIKRHQNGEFNLPLKLFYAQVIFGIDGTHLVRLNNEVQGTFKAKLRKAVKKGDPLFIDDVEDIFFTDQAEEDKEFGHITIAQYRDRRSVSFSFIYGTTNVKKYLSVGSEFLNEAQEVIISSPRSALALGMTAAENLIKARLAASPRVNIRTKKHSTLNNIFNHFVYENQTFKLGSDYLNSYKFFIKYFNHARYSPEFKPPHKATLKKHLRILNKLRDETLVMITEI